MVQYIVGAGEDEHLHGRQFSQLAGHAAGQPGRDLVGVEEVARYQQKVHALGTAKLQDAPEGLHLDLARALSPAAQQPEGPAQMQVRRVQKLHARLRHVPDIRRRFLILQPGWDKRSAPKKPRAPTGARGLSN